MKFPTNASKKIILVIISVLAMVNLLLPVSAIGAETASQGQSVSGYVYDVNGNAIQGATVTESVYNNSVTSDVYGYFAFDESNMLSPGDYNFTASKTGYTEKTVSATVYQNQPLTLPNFVLGSAPTIAFSDTAGHWALNSINSLVAKGAISGYPDGTFKPDNKITRAEFATVLVKAFNLQAKPGKEFADTQNHWAKDAISTASAYGIVNGYNETTFGPDDPITREQMAVMTVKAAGITGSGQGKAFGDSAQISSWATDAVAAASQNNIIDGYPDNTFKPKNNATRAEAVTVIVNALK